VVFETSRRFTLKRSLLVANSDNAMSGLYNHYFSSVGYRVETVSDGRACLDRIREDLPDMLLLDQQLPWGGGEGVLACLREESDLTRIPVILFADVLPIQELSRLLVPPVIRCLEKRCSVTTLRYCVDSAMACRQERLAKC
jgi:DNA-binding NtrC family response regulator